jgi:hypothetical protein
LTRPVIVVEVVVEVPSVKVVQEPDGAVRYSTR